MTFGRNLANNLGFGIIPNINSGASTSLLWSFWVAFLHFFFGPWGLKFVILSVKMSGVILTLLTLLGLTRISQYFVQNDYLRLFVLLFVVTIYPLSWAALSGMEVSLNIFLCVVALLFQIEGCSNQGTTHQRRIAAIFWTLAVITRPENLLLLVVMFPILAVNERLGFRKGFLDLALWSSPLIISYHIFYYWLGGHPFPSTLTAKMTERALPLIAASGNLSGFIRALVTSPMKDLAETFQFLFLENPLYPVLWFIAVFSVIRSFRSEKFLLTMPQKASVMAALMILPAQAIFVGLLAGPEFYTLFHGRYLAHTAVLSGIIAVSIASDIWFQRGKPKWIFLLLIPVGLFVIDRQIELAKGYGLEVQNISNLQVAFGRWFGEKMPQGLTVGMNDIGAFSYFANQKLVDLEGLATPDTIAWRRKGKLDEYLDKARPDFLLIFPYWYPDIIQKKDKYRPVLKRSVDHNYTGGGDELYLFLTPWTSYIPASWPVPPRELIPREVPVPK